MRTVYWKEANELTVEEILSMAEDGYEFTVEDGMVGQINVPVAA